VVTGHGSLAAPSSPPLARQGDIRLSIGLAINLPQSPLLMRGLLSLGSLPTRRRKFLRHLYTAGGVPALKRLV
jgi:hypothetical protein